MAASIFSHQRFHSAVSAWREFQATKLYDALTASPLILIFGMSAGRLAGEIWMSVLAAEFSSLDLRTVISLLGQMVAFALVFLMMIFLILRNPARAKAKGFLPRLAAFAGTYFGVALVWLPTQPIGLGLSIASLLLMLAGAAFSIYSISHLGRSFSIMAEGRRLVTDGPYSRIRHPLYLGEAVSLLGLTLQYFSPLALLVFAVQISFQLWRMKNEEGVLAGLFPEYEAYRMKTARLVPGLY